MRSMSEPVDLREVIPPVTARSHTERRQGMLPRLSQAREEPRVRIRSRKRAGRIVFRSSVESKASVGPVVRLSENLSVTSAHKSPPPARPPHICAFDRLISLSGKLSVWVKARTRLSDAPSRRAVPQPCAAIHESAPQASASCGSDSLGTLYALPRGTESVSQGGAAPMAAFPERFVMRSGGQNVRRSFQ